MHDDMHVHVYNTVQKGITLRDLQEISLFENIGWNFIIIIYNVKIKGKLF